jgi:PAS domain S-box-containing protein
MNERGLRISEPRFFGESPFSEADQETGDDLTTDPKLQVSSSAESIGMKNPNFTDLDQFELMKHRKRDVERICVYIGIPVLSGLALYNLIKGNYFVTFLSCLDLLIAILLGFMIRRRTDEKFEYKIYSILFRLFIAVVGIAILYQIGFQSSFSQIEWCYIYPILVFFAVGLFEGMIWMSIFYGILAFFMLNFDLQGITLFQIQELKYRFLISFFVVCMLSMFLQHGFRYAQQRLLNHQRILKESENRYRQAYEQLNTQMQERKQANEALQRSEEEAKRLAQENAIMAEIGRIISSTLNIEEVYERFAEEVRKLIPFDRIVINLIDTEKGIAPPLYMAGKEIGDRKIGEVYPLEGSGNAEMVRTKSSLLIQTEDFNEYKDRFPMLLSTFQAGFRSIMDVPLFSKGRIMGSLLLRSLKPYAYTVEDVRLAEKVGDQIAGAIASAQLFTERTRAEEAAKRLSQENAVMAEIGRIISSTLDINEVYNGFAEAVRHLIDFDRISTTIIDAQHHTATVAYAMGTQISGRGPGEVIPLSESMIEHILKTRSSVLVQTEDSHEIETRFPFLRASFRAGFRSMISVPLISKDQVIGALNLRSIKPNVYTERDLKIAESIGIQISGAIANALLFAEHKSTEEALRESEKKFRDLYDHAPLGYHEYNTEGYITNVNRTDLEMLGYTAEEMIGRPIWKLNVNEDTVREQVMAKLTGTQPPGKELERIYRRKDGTTFPVLIEDRLILDEKGCIRGIRSTIQDITERKRMEVALREKTEELARSNKDLEQFAYVASHDLQEPLRMVTSYVQLLARRYEGKLDSDADEFIGFAVDGAVRMWKLINDLLTYSRVGMRGKELEPTDSEAALSQSVNDLKVTIEENRALVTHDPLPMVMADRSQLGQLFQNLIGNAIKFRGNEPPRVHISASRNGNGWTFSVRDNGIGIAAEYSERIFIIFQRLHSRQEYAGTGIGLAICKKIVERHGGHIWVESEVGKGATFYFILPAAVKTEPLSS